MLHKNTDVQKQTPTKHILMLSNECNREWRQQLDTDRVPMIPVPSERFRVHSNIFRKRVHVNFTILKPPVQWHPLSYMWLVRVCCPVGGTH